MEQIIETIKRIEKARTALRQAIVDNEIATSPKLKDLNLIPKIYKVFEELKGKEIKVNDRKEFIFVVIYQSYQSNVCKRYFSDMHGVNGALHHLCGF